MTLILDEHFTGTTLSNIWEQYEGPDYGASGGDPADSYFLPRNLVISNTTPRYLSLLLKRETAPDGIGHYTGAGLETIPPQYQITTGRMEAKARFPPSNQGLIGYILAWPANQDWPPEIDFAETEGSSANLITFTQYGDNGTTYEANKSLDVTQWHIYTLDIDAVNNQITWWIDGVKIVTQTKHFATRTWVFGAGTWACLCNPPQYCGCPNNATLPTSMDIEYIKVWNAIPTDTILTSITVSPANVSINVSQSTQLTTVCKDQNGNTMSCPTMTWKTSNNTVAMVDSTGKVTGIAQGTANITATSGTIVSNSSAITVTTIPVPILTSITVSPANVSINVNQSTQLTTVCKDQNGNTMSCPTLTWNTSNNTVATVDSTGKVTGIAQGTANITAISGTIVSNSSAITVTTIPVPILTSITVSPANVSINVSQSTQLTTVCKDQNGNTMSCPTLTWSTSNPSIATVNITGMVTGMSVGSANVTAKSGTISSNVSAITVTPVPTASITITSPSTGVSYRHGDSKIIIWNSTGNVGPHVKIVLIKGTNTVKTLISSTNNDGRQQWIVPRVTSGSDYRIKITSTTNVNISGLSGKFTIR